MEDNNLKLVLITGGHGFLGSHLARRLHAMGAYKIRIVDIARKPPSDGPISHEFICGDLTDANVCRAAVQDVAIVFHFAANMGGMGAIHDQNDFVLYAQNHSMTTNLLEACLNANVNQFVYASSACVYPEALQADSNHDVSLQEDDVWTNTPPKPQGLYGLEKLISEILLSQLVSKMKIHIVRFHNVFGPGGAWNNGREKAPAAMIRKAIALQLLEVKHAEFEIWGSGKQRRSFLFVDDAIDGVLRLLGSSVPTLLNIGSDAAISIQELAEIALSQVGIDPSAVAFSYDQSKPVGVASRNSNNERSSSLLGWRPAVHLEVGMRRTEAWIRSEIFKCLPVSGDPRPILRQMLESTVLHLQPSDVVFAILLPITSRGGGDPNVCLSNLRKFAASLYRTTWRDTHTPYGTHYRIVVYIAIDHDDHFLLETNEGYSRAEDVLHDEGLHDLVTITCNHPRGHVCKIWKDCARKAYIDGCDYMVLMGDDVELKDEGWMREAQEEFQLLKSDLVLPFGFGCIAFTDTSFPGMPTFPIIHRTHMDLFKGEVIPDVFVNQDGDPFLFQLYRRWNCSRMFSYRLSNSIGGAGDARYTKHHVQDWTFKTLDDAVATAQDWLDKLELKVQRCVTLDVVVPCYRVDLSILDNILSLQCSSSCTVMFIIIIDNPSSSHIFELQAKYSQRPDVRIRVNSANLGASASRNRGMSESAADWVHFLDDDVVPDPRLLFEAEHVIRAHPGAAGFVGNTSFPRADTIFTTAVHLAGVTYFWDIATKINDDVPWGVTANLIARRHVKDVIHFDLRYPKTGGGEDIDFCRLKRASSLAHGGHGFFAAPDVKVTHPWWNNGSRSYWRFHYWSFGDGALVKRFPEHSYYDFAPNSAELILICSLLGGVGAILVRSDLILTALKSVILVVLVNIFHDYFRHLLQSPERNVGMNSSLTGLRWLFAIFESSLIRIFSELGRLRGMIVRGEYGLLGRRFDWFAGRVGRGPIREERINSLQRAIIVAIAVHLFAI